MNSFLIPICFVVVEFPVDSLPPHATSGCSGASFTSVVKRQPIGLTPQFEKSRSEEFCRLIRDRGCRSLCQLITDATFTEDSISTKVLEKPGYLFGDHVEDPAKLILDDKHWLNNDEGLLLYIPSIPRQHSLTHLETGAVRRQISWNLTDDRDRIHCGFISHHKTPGSDGYNYIRDLQPGILGLDTAPTVRNRLAKLERKLPSTEFRCFD